MEYKQGPRVFAVTLGQAAINRGHEVWVMGVGDLAYDPDENIRARATGVPKNLVATAACSPSASSKSNASS